jgi:hypothetical protein
MYIAQGWVATHPFRLLPNSFALWLYFVNDFVEISTSSFMEAFMVVSISFSCLE